MSACRKCHNTRLVTIRRWSHGSWTASRDSRLPYCDVGCHILPGRVTPAEQWRLFVAGRARALRRPLGADDGLLRPAGKEWSGETEALPGAVTDGGMKEHPLQRTQLTRPPGESRAEPRGAQPGAAGQSRAEPGRAKEPTLSTESQLGSEDKLETANSCWEKQTIPREAGP